jgi:antitoxin component YwqK of YwqJK toxin-antitoxin module
MKRVPANKVRFEDDGLYYCDGEPFTGVKFTEFPDGSLRSESEYRDGLRWGKSREWHKNGTLVSEAEFFRDVLHGVAREWSPAGRPESEIVCEYGITLHEREWDDEGNLVKEHKIQEGSRDHQRLLSLKKAYDAESVR